MTALSRILVATAIVFGTSSLAFAYSGKMHHGKRPTATQLSASSNYAQAHGRFVKPFTVEEQRMFDRTGNVANLP